MAKLFQCDNPDCKAIEVMPFDGQVPPQWATVTLTPRAQHPEYQQRLVGAFCPRCLVAIKMAMGETLVG